MIDKNENASIEYILAQGLVKPPIFRERVSKMFRVLGPKFIFWDLSYSLIFASITILGITVLFFHAPMDYQYSVAILFSPVLFLIIMLFAEMNERSCGLCELKQACRYTPRQITALRCICYSVVGVVFVVIVTAVFTENITQFLRLLPLCLCGLFLCALAELFVMRLSQSKWIVAVFSALWMLVNLMLPFVMRERWELFLSGLPLVFTIAFALFSAAGFIYQTNKMLLEEKFYAYA